MNLFYRIKLAFEIGSLVYTILKKIIKELSTDEDIEKLKKKLDDNEIKI